VLVCWCYAAEGVWCGHGQQDAPWQCVLVTCLRWERESGMRFWRMHAFLGIVRCDLDGVGGEQEETGILGAWHAWGPGRQEGPAM
jgi:hypothetical protein